MTDDLGIYKEETEKAEQGKSKKQTYQARIEEAYREVMGSKSGVLLIRHILDKTGFFASRFTGNSQTFYLEGRADIGRELLTEIAAFNSKAFMKVCLQGLKSQKHKEDN